MRYGNIRQTEQLVYRKSERHIQYSVNWEQLRLIVITPFTRVSLQKAAGHGSNNLYRKGKCHNSTPKRNLMNSVRGSNAHMGACVYWTPVRWNRREKHEWPKMWITYVYSNDFNLDSIRERYVGESPFWDDLFQFDEGFSERLLLLLEIYIIFAFQLCIQRQCSADRSWVNNLSAWRQSGCE